MRGAHAQESCYITQVRRAHAQEDCYISVHMGQEGRDRPGGQGQGAEEQHGVALPHVLIEPCLCPPTATCQSPLRRFPWLYHPPPFSSVPPLCLPVLSVLGNPSASGSGTHTAAGIVLVHGPHPHPDVAQQGRTAGRTAHMPYR